MNFVHFNQYLSRHTRHQFSASPIFTVTFLGSTETLVTSPAGWSNDIQTERRLNMDIFLFIINHSFLVYGNFVLVLSFIYQGAYCRKKSKLDPAKKYQQEIPLPFFAAIYLLTFSCWNSLNQTTRVLPSVSGLVSKQSCYIGLFTWNNNISMWYAEVYTCIYTCRFAATSCGLPYFGNWSLSWSTLSKYSYQSSKRNSFFPEIHPTETYIFTIPRRTVCLR